jgi:hypothetical protein
MITTWVERCKKFEDSEIITYEKIQEVMQEEIDELRKELALQKLSDISQEIENEPVAWMFRGYLYDTDPSDWAVHEHPNVPVIPLYTHPIRELTEDTECQYLSNKLIT